MTKITIVGLLEDRTDRQLIQKFMRLRAKVFIEDAGWELHQTEGMEFDQYDRLDAAYVIAQEGAEVIGGIRLARTLNPLKNYNGPISTSYMIRDAYLGLLEPGLPKSLCTEEPPIGRDIWEASRIASVGGNGVLIEMLIAGIDYMKGKNATECMFIGPPAFKRIGRMLGHSPEALGPVIKDGDSKFQAFRCDLLEQGGGHSE